MGNHIPTNIGDTSPVGSWRATSKDYSLTNVYKERQDLQVKWLEVALDVAEGRLTLDQLFSTNYDSFTITQRQNAQVQMLEEALKMKKVNPHLSERSLLGSR